LLLLDLIIKHLVRSSYLFLSICMDIENYEMMEQSCRRCVGLSDHLEYSHPGKQDTKNVHLGTMCICEE
jgi:hypothetical protein